MRDTNNFIFIINDKMESNLDWGEEQLIKYNGTDKHFMKYNETKNQCTSFWLKTSYLDTSQNVLASSDSTLQSNLGRNIFQD